MSEGNIQGKQLTLVIKPDGTVWTDWWTPDYDFFLNQNKPLEWSVKKKKFVRKGKSAIKNDPRSNNLCG